MKRIAVWAITLAAATLWSVPTPIEPFTFSVIPASVDLPQASEETADTTAMSDAEEEGDGEKPDGDHGKAGQQHGKAGQEHGKSRGQHGKGKHLGHGKGRR